MDKIFSNSRNAYAPMKMLSASILILSGAVMFGAARLAQLIAAAGNWQDKPVSMCWIGSLFTITGFALLIYALCEDRERNMKPLSGAILVLSGAILFGCGKVAMAIAGGARREVPVALLAIACTFSLGGFVLLIWGLRDDRRRSNEQCLQQPASIEPNDPNA